MKAFEIFDLFADELAGVWKVSAVQGSLLILLGILILVAPQVLAAIAAAFCIFLGLTFLGFAWKYRSFQKQYQNRFRFEIRDIF